MGKVHSGSLKESFHNLRQTYLVRFIFVYEFSVSSELYLTNISRRNFAQITKKKKFLNKCKLISE